MQVLKGDTAGFLYETVRGELRPRIAGTSVLVLNCQPNPELLIAAAALDYALFVQRAIDNAALGEGYLDLTKDALARKEREAVSRELQRAGLGHQAFERDDCLFAACTEVSFHHDLPLAGVFGAWCLTGPARDLVFPRLELRVPFVPGTLVIFDAVQPHGLLAPGDAVFKANASKTPALTVFVSLLLRDNDPVTNTLLRREVFEETHHRHLPRLAQGEAADPFDGMLKFSII
jgi:hypothetical protein